MGSGKSTLGKQLAQQLRYDFQDLDNYIETLNKCTITEFFNRYGEHIFRKEERHRLTELCLKDNIVIAVGGGTPCFKNNMKLMNYWGTTIFIDPPINLLFQRLKHRAAHRPLLAAKTEDELFEFLKKNHAERLPFYQQAQYTLQAENIRVQDFLPFF